MVDPQERPVTPVRWGGSGIGLVEILVAALIVGLASQVIVPAYLRSTAIQDTHRCFAVQRQILAAIDAYETDTGQLIAEISTSLGLLVENGYLSHFPVDPGSPGSASLGHFGRSAHGRVYCWVHGSPWEPGITPVRSPMPPPPTRYSPPPLVAASPVSKIPMIRKFPGLWR